MSAAARAPRRREDNRGVIAVVSAAVEGPSVMFLGKPELGYENRLDRMAFAAQMLGFIYADNDGTERLSYPRMVFVQRRPGAWESLS